MPSSLHKRARQAIWLVAAFAVGAVATALTLPHVSAGLAPSHIERTGPAAAQPGHAAASPSRAPGAAASIGAAASAAYVPGEAAAGTSAASGTDEAADAASDWPDDAPTPEQVFTAQPEQMRVSLAKLARRVPGKTNVYAIAFAGDGSEDVFRNEAEYLDQLMSQRFGSADHTLILENNPAALTTRPLASWTNLEAALDGLARVMDPQNDVLLLYIATHGGSDHSLLVDMDPVPLDQIDPDGLADIFAKHPFRWKVVVVNACYSGGFVPKLHGDGTLLMTSARADRTSFGCGADSDITYFGRAWLVDGLNATPDFVDAFTRARGEIAGWEAKDALTPSEPQIDIGPGIAGKLAKWRQGVRTGPAVPFAAAR